jgi:hypothetical protein
MKKIILELEAQFDMTLNLIFEKYGGHVVA